jgi:hypothetical protein
MRARPLDGYTHMTVYDCLMLVRKQIVVPSDVDKRIRRLARRKGISQSALIVEAVEALPETSSQLEHLLAFAGLVKEAPPQLSEEVDEVVYR